MKNLIKIVQIGFSILLFWIIFTRLDLDKLKEILISVDLVFILFFMLIYPVSVFISTHRWRVVLTRKHIQIPFWQLYRSYWIGSFYNNFFHEIGGDFYKSYQLSKRYHISVKRLFLTTFVERLSGFFCLLFLALIFGFSSIWKIIETINFNYQLIIFLGAGLFFLGGIIKFNSQIKTKVKSLKIFLEPKMILQLTFWSLMFIFEGLVAYYFIFASLGHRLSFLELLSSVPLIQLTSVIPITPNALGVTEGMAVLLLTPKGLSVEVIITAMLLIRSLLFISNAVGAIVFQIYTHGSPWVPKPEQTSSN